MPIELNKTYDSAPQKLWTELVENGEHINLVAYPEVPIKCPPTGDPEVNALVQSHLFCSDGLCDDEIRARLAAERKFESEPVRFDGQHLPIYRWWLYPNYTDGIYSKTFARVNVAGDLVVGYGEDTCLVCIRYGRPTLSEDTQKPCEKRYFCRVGQTHVFVQVRKITGRSSMIATHPFLPTCQFRRGVVCVSCRFSRLCPNRAFLTFRRGFTQEHRFKCVRSNSVQFCSDRLIAMACFRRFFRSGRSSAQTHGTDTDFRFDTRQSSVRRKSRHPYHSDGTLLA